MACSGGYCASQCYVNVCNTYVAPNEAWNYNATGAPFPDSSGDVIHDENMTRLALSINDERVRRGIPQFTFDTVTGGDIIYGNNASQEMMKDIKTAINGISSGYVTYTIVDGNPVTWLQIREAKNKIQALRNSCLCNSDCGGHLVCSCYHDCGCYYSDERLKKDIRSL